MGEALDVDVTGVEVMDAHSGTTGRAQRGVELDSGLADEQYRLFAVYSWMSATTTAAMGSKWQPIEVGMHGMECTTQAIVDLDVLGLLQEKLG